jgi:hypothetical protein
MVNASFLHV